MLIAASAMVSCGKIDDSSTAAKDDKNTVGEAAESAASESAETTTTTASEASEPEVTTSSEVADEDSSIIDDYDKGSGIPIDERFIDIIDQLTDEELVNLDRALEDVANITSEDIAALWEARDDFEAMCEITDRLFHADGRVDSEVKPIYYYYGDEDELREDVNHEVSSYAIQFEFIRNLRYTNDDPNDKFKVTWDDGIEISITKPHNAKYATGLSGTVLLRRFDTDGTELPIPEREGTFSRRYVLYWLARGICYGDPGDPFYR